MAAVGLATNYMNQKSQAANNERQAKMAASQAEFSPWTHAAITQPDSKPVDVVGGALTGAAQGALSGAMMKNANQNKQPEVPNNPSAPMSDNMEFANPQDQMKQNLYGQTKAKYT